jgi:hypothetical protein
MATKRVLNIPIEAARLDVAGDQLETVYVYAYEIYGMVHIDFVGKKRSNRFQMPIDVWNALKTF